MAKRVPDFAQDYEVDGESSGSDSDVSVGDERGATFEPHDAWIASLSVYEPHVRVQLCRAYANLLTKQLKALGTPPLKRQRAVAGARAILDGGAAAPDEPQGILGARVD